MVREQLIIILFLLIFFTVFWKIYIPIFDLLLYFVIHKILKTSFENLQTFHIYTLQVLYGVSFAIYTSCIYYFGVIDFIIKIFIKYI